MGELEETIPKTVLDLLDEARLCFYGAAFRGVVAICRSCVEESLHQRGIQGKDLAEKIESAQKKVKLLGEAEVT